jgi:hypothetical protein
LTDRSAVRGLMIATALAVVLLPGVLLAPLWRLGGLGANEDDLLYYYPSRVFFGETIAAGHLPWINPAGGMDRPYVADPQSAVWYPFTWLFAILPPLWAYALSLWAHYSIALWGMYRLLRSQRLGRRAAFFGGLIFAFSGFMLAHRAHFTMIQAAAWTPWVFWALGRYVRTGRGEPAAAVRRLIVAAVLSALQCFAGHVQIAAITAVGVLVYLLARRRTANPGESAATGIGAIVARWLIVWVCVAGLFTVQWLPTLAYVRVCTRAERTFGDFVENSWSPTAAVGWVLPMLYGQRAPGIFTHPYWGPTHKCEQFAYVGLLPLLLVAVGLRAGWRADPLRRPWVFLALGSLLLALGRYGPICPILYWLPGASLFRAPARALLLFDLSLAALAAAALHDLAAGLTPARARLRAALQRWTRRPLVAGVLLVAVPLVLVALAVPLMSADVRQSALASLRPWLPGVFLPLVLAVASFAVLGYVALRWRQPRRLWFVVALTAVDLGLMGWTLDVPAGVHSPRDLLHRPDESWLEQIRESGQRLWVVTDTDGVYNDPLSKRVANTSALAGVRSLTEYGPLHPVAYQRRFTFAPWGVSRRTSELLQRTDWIRPCNVGWLLLCDPKLPAPAGGELRSTTPAGHRLYHCPGAAGPAFFADPTQPGAVQYAENAPAEFVTRVDTWPAASAKQTPARLVVSRLALPGWHAHVGGRALPVTEAEGGLLSVAVPAGQAETIIWRYTPPALAEGALVSILSVTALVAIGLVFRRR